MLLLRTKELMGHFGMSWLIPLASSPSEVTVAVRIFQISQRVTWRAATKIYDRLIGDPNLA